MATNKQQVLLRQLTGIQADIAIGLKKAVKRKEKEYTLKVKATLFKKILNKKR